MDPSKRLTEAGALWYSGRMNKHKKLIVWWSLGISLVVALAVLFLARGWLRGSLVPMVVKNAVIPAMQRDFKQDFPPITEKLAEFGFTFDGDGYIRDTTRCEQYGYSGFSSTHACFIAKTSDILAPTDTFKKQWNEKAPAFENSVLQAGWEKTWNAAQPIDELFLDHHQSVGVNYLKKHGKTVCRLTIAHLKNTERGNFMHVREECNRGVKLFGGY